jgi:hypothetical protein
MKNITAAYLHADGHVVLLIEKTLRNGRLHDTREYAEVYEQWTKATLRFEGRIVFHRHYAPAYLRLAKIATEIRATVPGLEHGSENTKRRGLHYGDLTFSIDGGAVSIPTFSDGTDWGGWQNSICSNGYCYQPKNTDTFSSNTEGGHASTWCDHPIIAMHPILTAAPPAAAAA